MSSFFDPALLFSKFHILWLDHIGLRNRTLCVFPIQVLTLTLYAAEQENIAYSVKEFKTEIGRNFHWDSNTIEKYLATLRAFSLVEYRQSNTDRRKQFIQMTPELSQRWQNFNRAFEEMLGDKIPTENAFV